MLARAKCSPLHGYVDPRFSGIMDAFNQQLVKRGGGALTVYYKNQCVVDLWGGQSNSDGDPWQQDSMSLVFSVTKGIVATLFHILVSDGLCHYDDKVCAYWPEFARHGKDAITIRQVLCHEAGLYHIRDMIDHAQYMIHWHHMIEAIEEATPIHVPGQSHGYHALTFGWLMGELIQRISGMRLSQFLKTRLVEPLQLDGLYIGALDDVALSRRAHLVDDSNLPLQRGRYPLLRLFGLRIGGEVLRCLQGKGTAGFSPSDTIRSLGPIGIEDIDFNSAALAKAAIPSANGVCTARAVAKVYAMLANGGHWQGVEYIRPEIVRQAASVQNDGVGRVIPIPLQWRLGYHRVFAWPYKMQQAFGHLGFGGSGAWCDPERQLAVSLIFNNGVGTPVGDLRLTRINHAVLRVVDRYM